MKHNLTQHNILIKTCIFLSGGRWEGSIKFIVTRTMSADLIVASFEFDKESSSFGFPFCAQVKKIFLIIFCVEESVAGKTAESEGVSFLSRPSKILYFSSRSSEVFWRVEFNFLCEFSHFYIQSNSYIFFLISWYCPISSFYSWNVILTTYN